MSILFIFIAILIFANLGSALGSEGAGCIGGLAVFGIVITFVLGIIGIFFSILLSGF